VVFAPALHDPDRAVVLAALDALDAANGEVPPEILDDVFHGYGTPFESWIA
jgi:hypothetical protein